ncbi:hypothetical protein HMPREF9282_02100 [Veillonella seminalis ACS-216-V-Col6b]|uniref:Bacterial type II secretion system protein E domain-containing protein n=1 Tax=Veillonella seminalis ACS-216-V-Col6b TaxID=883156 RepID=K9CZG8_9FIRM|nr:hypothetical protein HMPREF9282_02100 [Veillonella seminalis ACS-216-V-Col6b]
MKINRDNLSRKDIFLLNSFGEDVLNLIEDDEVNEVYVNHDYYVWKDTIYGRVKTDILLKESTVRSICEAIAGVNDDIISETKPELGVELVNLEIRAQLVYPPISRRPIFFLRKKPAKVYTLEDYKSSGSLSEAYYDVIVKLIKERKNVVVAGATGSGKTTFLNAILCKLSEVSPEHRLLLLEDLPELKSTSKDVQRLTVSGNKSTKISMQDLVFIAMRMSPHRIIVGEVRNQAAYDMLKAWNTGHEGGFCTIHANSTENTFLRLESLVRESPQVNDTEMARTFIGASINAVISIQKKVSDTGTIRLIDDIILVHGYNSSTKQFEFTHL